MKPHAKAQRTQRENQFFRKARNLIMATPVILYFLASFAPLREIMRMEITWVK
jgi:hypothetical protein